MSDGQPNQEIRLELFVRSLLPRGTCDSQQAVLGRLEDLSDDDAIDAFEVTVWGRGISPTTAAAETDAGRELQRLVDAFSEWARERGLTLRPRFERRPVRSRITGEEYDAILFPAMALAAYRGGDLSFVAPCADGTTMYTVEDVLEVVRNDGVDRLDPDLLPDEGSARTVSEATTADRR